MRWKSRLLIACLAATAAVPCAADDWPTWRLGPRRRPVLDRPLPETLHFQWMRELPAPRTAWPRSQTKLRFDASYEPVVVGRRIFVPSMVADSLTAYDTRTGAELWRFYADGPIRFAPAAGGPGAPGLYFACDDGCLYCLDQATGTLKWKFAGAPDARKVIGNGRLVSAWPARGAPLLMDGTVYFAAGIWPFMGTFVYAVDARTGREVWCNSGSGSIWMNQPHRGAVSFAAVAPQGYLAAGPDGPDGPDGPAEKRLLVPCGRSAPAVFDRRTGKLEYFNMHKKNGGYDLMVGADLIFNGGGIFGVKKGTDFGEFPAAVVLDDCMIGVQDGVLVAQGLKPEVYYGTVRSRGRWKIARKVRYELLWKTPVPFTRAYFLAGSRLYGGRTGAVAAVQIPPEDHTVRITWQAALPGTVWNMLAGDERVFVVTTEGGLFCYGPDRAAGRIYHAPLGADWKPAPFWTDRRGPGGRLADRIRRASGAGEGYCVVFGAGDPGAPGVVDRLLATTNLHVIAVDRDAGKVAALRRRLDDAGLYGTRASAHVGDPASLRLPPYLAELIVCLEPPAPGAAGEGEIRAVFAALRPYGGVACFLVGAGGGAAAAEVSRFAAGLKLPGAEIGQENKEPPAAVYRGGDPKDEPGSGLVLLRRKGALPGSAHWTHQYADAGNSVTSRDALVRAPLGLLWFGGPPNDEILPRHGHGPSPQVVDGRLLIEGATILRAVDVYTGRVLWQADLPGLGDAFDTTRHQPGAGGYGSNYVSLPDGIYVARGRSAVRLDPATGKKVREFPLPPVSGSPRPNWGYINVAGDVLLAGADPLHVQAEIDEDQDEDEEDGNGNGPRVLDVGVTRNAPYAVASKDLVAMDRHTGRVLWTRAAQDCFRHNAIAVGGGKVFCIDRTSPWRAGLLRRRGIGTKGTASLLALDLKTGSVVWETRQDVFGTWLGYSAAHGVLLQAGSRARDRPLDEAPAGMVAYRAATGEVLWRDLSVRYSGPPMLWHDWIICQGTAFELLTGKPVVRPHPLTGEPVKWGFRRTYGCNTAVAGENLLTFRSGAAGFYDLARDGGTGNFGGFKSGCTSNLIVADGVLNAPDYTRTCTCAYQNQSSLALVPMADAEMWTFSSYRRERGAVRRVGLNFGAPGDRRADDGTLWLDCPSVGGFSPDPPVKIAPKGCVTFREHALRVVAGEPKWVAASGLRGVESVAVTLADPKAKPPPAQRAYTVRLYFAEMDASARPGGRAFGVALQGKEVLQDFDIVRAADGARRLVVKEFRGVRVKDVLRVSFQAAPGAPADAASISGIEIVEEN